MKTPSRILIIEDNPDDEALLMRQLKKAGLQEHVKAIHDGAKALAYFTDERVALQDLVAVFLDLKLPRVSGLEILEAIRAGERTQHLTVIVMTSSNSPQQMEKCKELGVSCYVQKPLTFSSFAKAFADTFHERRAAAGSEMVSVGTID